MEKILNNGCGFDEMQCTNQSLDMKQIKSVDQIKNWIKKALYQPQNAGFSACSGLVGIITQHVESNKEDYCKPRITEN